MNCSDLFVVVTTIVETNYFYIHDDLVFMSEIDASGHLRHARRELGPGHKCAVSTLSQFHNKLRQAAESEFGC